MSLPLAVPPELVRDAIAKIDRDGCLLPVTCAMRDWIAAVAGGPARLALAKLPIEDDEKVALADGEPVMMATPQGLWQLQKMVSGDADWLVVIDVTDRERHITAELETARSRSLARMAATMAHDLNNQFNLVLALSAHLDDFIQDDADRAITRELERDTIVGSRMASVLARLLVRRGHSRELFSSAEMLADALSMMSKSLQQAGVNLQVEVAAEMPNVRGSAVEVVQSVMSILMAFEHLGTANIRCAMTRESFAIADGRLRDCVVWRCTAGPWNEGTMAPLLAVLNAEQGSLSHVASNPEIMAGVANALFAQKRMGGDLQAKRDGDALCLTFVWPAARA
jgi:hypothetical protein